MPWPVFAVPADLLAGDTHVQLDGQVQPNLNTCRTIIAISHLNYPYIVHYYIYYNSHYFYITVLLNYAASTDAKKCVKECVKAKEKKNHTVETPIRSSRLDGHSIASLLDVVTSHPRLVPTFGFPLQPLL